MPISKLGGLAAGAVAALIAAAPAVAADLPLRGPAVPAAVPVSTSGFYLATRTGITMTEDTSFRVGNPGNPTAGVLVDNEYEIGVTNFIGLGYNFGQIFGPGIGVRAELEGFFSQIAVDVHRVNGTAIDAADSFGQVRTFGGFASGYVDFRFGGDGFLGALTPYVGGGVGMAQVRLSKQGISATGVIMNDKDTRFAYHLSAGVGIDLGQLVGGPLFNRTTLEVGYRYLSVPDLEFQARDATVSSTDLSSHIVTIGMRRQF